MQDIIVTIPDSQNQLINSLIEEFIKKLESKNQSLNYYAQKRATTIDKARKDQFLGKKAEFLTLYYLHKQKSYPLIKVDLEIREGKKKNWVCDLPFSEAGNFPDFHVKSCNKSTFNLCNDYSWTFQNSNKNGIFGKDPILNGSEDYISLVYLEDPLKNYGIIKAILPCKDILPFLKDPKLERLKNIKKCLYYRDLHENQSSFGQR